MTPIDDLSEKDWLRLVGEAASLPSAPSAAVRAALELWRDHAPAAPVRRWAIPKAGAVSGGSSATGRRVRRWIAALTFDSWAMPATEAGIRSVPSESRHLLFAAAGRDIDLRIAPMTAGFVVSGQHLGSTTLAAVAWHSIGAESVPPRSLRSLPPEGAGPPWAWPVPSLSKGSGGGPATPQHRVELTPSGEFCIEGVERGTYALELRFADEDIVLAPITVGTRGSDL